MSDGKIVISTEIDNTGAEKDLAKTKASIKTQVEKLATEYKKQEENVKSLEAALNNAKSAYGENSKEVKALEQELAKATKSIVGVC